MELTLQTAPRAPRNLATRSSVAATTPTRASRSKGCWTCRLRRKKWDENWLVCDTCKTLLITCHDHEAKLMWMDSGVLQKEMAEQLKRDVKERAAQRRAAQAYSSCGDGSPTPRNLSLFGGHNGPSTNSAEDADANMAITPETSEVHARSSHFVFSLGGGDTQQRTQDCILSGKVARGSVPFTRSDTVLLVFYLEHLFQILFSFYQPSILKGGRAWILEMIISSPVMREAILCHSSYFYSLAQSRFNVEMSWETMLKQTGNAFEALKQSLLIFKTLSVTECHRALIWGCEDNLSYFAGAALRGCRYRV